MVKPKKLLPIILCISMLTGCGGSTADPSHDANYTQPPLKSAASQEPESAKSLPLLVNKGKFNITQYEIDDSYVLYPCGFPEEKVPLSKELGEAYFDHAIFEAIDDENIYITRHWEDNMSYSRINYREKYIETDIYTGQCNIQFTTYAKDGWLYVGEAVLQEDGLLCTFKRILVNGEKGPGQEEIILQEFGNKYPDIGYSKNYINVTYADWDNHSLGYINYDDLEYHEIYRSDVLIEGGGKYTGEIPLYSHGDDNGIYFQVITLNQEALDFEGTQQLYYYSFREQAATPVMDLKDKVTYVTGNEDFVVLNYYSVDNPRVQTGKVLSLKDNKVVGIPETTAVNDIRYAYLEDTLFYMATTTFACVYDVNTKLFTIHKITTSSTRTGMLAYKTAFCYVDPGKDKVVFHLLTYEPAGN